MPVVNPIQPGRPVRRAVPLVGGMFFRDANTRLIDDLSDRGLLFRAEPYEHSYPHCWRCHTPLLYYALPAWYIRTTAIKDRLLAGERADQLVPADDQGGPVRRVAAQQRRLVAVAQPLLGHAAAAVACATTSHATCVGSLAELGELAGRDLSGAGPAPAVRRRRHVRLPASAAARPRRVPEVIDAWYDSGAMPFAQWGAPHRQRGRRSRAPTRRSTSARRSTRPAAGSTR